MVISTVKFESIYSGRSVLSRALTDALLQWRWWVGLWEGVLGEDKHALLVGNVSANQLVGNQVRKQALQLV